MLAFVLLVTAGGSATAASLIDSGDVENGSLRSEDIKNGTLQHSDIKDGTIDKDDIKMESITLNRLSENTQEKINAGGGGSAAGPAGPAGPAGANGVSGYEVSTFHYDRVGAGDIATVACSAGKVAVGGGYWFNNGPGGKDFDFAHPSIINGSGIIASFPGRMDFDGVDNIPDTEDDATVKPNDNSGWIVQMNDRVGQNLGEPPGTPLDFDQPMTLYAICVNA